MLENVWDIFWLLIYIYCWPFKPILGFLGFGGDPLAPLQKFGVFWVNFQKNLNFSFYKTYSPLKIRMFAKNQTLIEFIENKINFLKNGLDMSSSLGAKIKMAAIFMFLTHGP